MKVKVDDYPTRFIVGSESESDTEYRVNLCEYPRGEDAEGNTIFNGSCGINDGFRTCGCPYFRIKCEPQLKRPENAGKLFRCKHIRVAREHALDFMLLHLCRNDPNIPEEHQT